MCDKWHASRMENDVALGIRELRRHLTAQREWVKADRSDTSRLLAGAREAIDRSRELLARPIWLPNKPEIP
jgi:hypothetical protein